MSGVLSVCQKPIDIPIADWCLYSTQPLPPLFHPQAGFLAIQEQQKLMVEFADYPNVLIRMLNNCIKEPHSHLAVFVMKQDVDARLDFIQNMEYKFVELMSCHFIRSPEEIVQHQITFRYNAVKTRLNMMQGRLEDVNNLVKLKNPSLLLQLQKSTTSWGGR